MKLPAYSIPVILKLERKVRGQLESLQGIGAVSAGSLEELTDILMPCIKGSFKDRCASRKALQSILVRYLDKTLTEPMLNSLARRIAGNADNIREGGFIRKWNPFCKPSWACLKIIDLRRIHTEGRRYAVRVESYTGITSGKRWVRNMSSAFIQHIIRNIGGNKYATYEDEDLFGLWFTAAVYVDKGNIQFKYLCASNSQKRLNKDMLKKRSGTSCTGGFHKGPCCICPYGTDRCVIARHPKTYKKLMCRNEKPFKHLGYIEENGYCMECIRKGRYSQTNSKRRYAEGRSVYAESETGGEVQSRSSEAGCPSMRFERSAKFEKNMQEERLILL